jgi:hypothetical protein
MKGNESKHPFVSLSLSLPPSLFSLPQERTGKEEGRNGEQLDAGSFILTVSLQTEYPSLPLSPGLVR